MKVAIVVIGASLGGFDALCVFLSGIRGRFRPPIAVVLHRAPSGTDSLAGRLQAVSSLPVSEPDDKTPIEPAHVYVAPADYHLKVERGHFSLDIGPKVRGARPAVDVLFETAASAYGDGVLAVVLTGTGFDGAQGALSVREAGGMVVVQDSRNAEAPAMPAAAAVSGRADLILPLAGIAGFVQRMASKSSTDG